MSRNLFNSIKQVRPKRNRFDLTHDVKMSCNMGDLVPTLVMECVPGDTVKLGCDCLARLAPMVAPMMHRVDISMHYFFVPNRILWPNWEKYVTQASNGALISGPLPAFPTVTIGDPEGTPIAGVYNKLCDYMGFPDPAQSGGYVAAYNALPFAAYQRIWYEFYRDQNLQNTTDIDGLTLIDGSNNSFQFVQMRKRCWEHDYFTAALPFAQKGAAVELPITQGVGDVPVFTVNPAAEPFTEFSWDVNEGTGNQIEVPYDEKVNAPTDPVSLLYAKTSDLSADAATINELRKAFKLQEWLEKQARGGSRYVEQIWSHFGVSSPDKRLQRPEYITGIKSPVVISEVLNTTGTDTAPQGTMAGHGVGVAQGRYGSYFCQEHGYIIGVMSVMPKTAYQQGIPKHYLKINSAVDDLFWPTFAHLGEQPVLNTEVYAGGVAPNDVFGYVPRYAEYKFMQNRVAGDFRTTLDFWHMGRIFSSAPALNEAFVAADPTFRVFADTEPSEDHLWMQILHKISAIRAMPKFGTPYL